MDQSLFHTKDPLKLSELLDLYGVAVLENYFEDNYADEVFESAKKWLIKLNIGLTSNPKDWTSSNMPMGPRYGMYQSIVSHCPAF